jgi:two-component system nitrogen regulation sensor histidine kinase NtrY
MATPGRVRIPERAGGAGPATRRRREIVLIATTALAVILFTAFGTRLPQMGAQGSVGNDVILVALINVQLILLVLLVFLVGRNVAKLVLERRRRILGSHLSTRLLLAFVAIALFPAVLLLLVALTFMDNSIERWFDVQVEESLQGSIEVAQEYYQHLASTGAFYGQSIADDLARRELLRRDRRPELRDAVRAAGARNRFEIVEVFNVMRHHLARGRARGVAEEMALNPRSRLLDDALAGRQSSGVDQVGGADVVRVAVPIYGPGEGGRVLGAVVIGRIVPPSVAERKLEIDRSFGEYVRLKIQQNPIKTSYTIALVLVSVLVVFSAIWLSFRLARGITVPIKRLAEGTRAVAHGDWDHRIEGEGQDEIGTLVGAFNQMTADLKATNLELEARRRYVELVLANIAGGVVSVDRSGIVTTINKGAEAMLGIQASMALGRPYADVFVGEEVGAIADLFSEILAGTSPGSAVDGAYEIERPDALRNGRPHAEGQITVTVGARARALHVSAAQLRDEATTAIGALVFLEDVTETLKVQRMEAWREVARRIAHEIKNPLTPIGLSAQRLRRRYAGRLEDGGAVFEECTRTIEQQVSELKSLVNEFAAFARMPSGEHAPQDLRRITEEAVALFRQAHPEIEFHLEGSPDLPPLELARAGIKRAIINLLDNAVVACAAVPWVGRIDVSTSYDVPRDVVVLEIADNGIGMSPEVKARSFEPGFSTKQGGTGLGLAIVAGVVSEHQGFIRARDNSPCGSRFVIELPAKTHRPMAVAGGRG